MDARHCPIAPGRRLQVPHHILPERLHLRDQRRVRYPELYADRAGRIAGARPGRLEGHQGLPPIKPRRPVPAYCPAACGAHAVWMSCELRHSARPAAPLRLVSVCGCAD